MSVNSSIQMDSAGGGTNGGPLSPGQAVNGVSIDASGRVVLGQDVGAAGDPAILLNDREIPMENFNIAFPNLFGSQVSIQGDNSSLIRLSRGQGNNQFMWEVETKPSPGPGQNGNFYCTIDESTVNPDGQIDAVMEIGYNPSGGGGPHKLDEPAMWIAMESHFQQGGGAQMEFHLQSVAKNGNGNRHISITPNIDTGDAIGFSQINSYFWQSCNDPLIYFGVDNSGGMDLNGPNTAVNWTNTNPAFGQLSFAFNSSGDVQINNGTTGADNVIGFSNALKVENSNINFSSIDIPLVDTPNATGISINGTVTGNAFSYFTQMDVSGVLFDQMENLNAGGVSLHLVLTAQGTGQAFSKWAFNNGGAFEGFAAGIDQSDANKFKMAYGTGLLNDPNVMTVDPAAHAGFGGMTTPTAWVHINASDGAAGNGPLKLTPGPLVAAPEDGLIEYDGVNFFKTIGAVRSIIL